MSLRELLTWFYPHWVPESWWWQSGKIFLKESFHTSVWSSSLTQHFMKVTENLLRMSWGLSPYSVKIMAIAMMKVMCMNAVSATQKGHTLGTGMRFSLVLPRKLELTRCWWGDSALIPWWFFSQESSGMSHAIWSRWIRHLLLPSETLLLIRQFFIFA